MYLSNRQGCQIKIKKNRVTAFFWNETGFKYGIFSDSYIVATLPKLYLIDIIQNLKSIGQFLHEKNNEQSYLLWTSARKLYMLVSSLIIVTLTNFLHYCQIYWNLSIAYKFGDF